MAQGIGLAIHRRIEERNKRLLGKLKDLEPHTDEVTALEALWHKLKFVVLESDPSRYFEVRSAFNNYRRAMIAYPELKERVFLLFGQALTTPLQETNMVNLLTHIWGYLKKRVGEDEKAQVLPLLKQLSDGQLHVAEELYDRFSALYERYGKVNLLDPEIG